MQVKRQSGEGKTVAAYLSALPKDKQAALERLRKTIRAAAPKATEGIIWGMPGFRLNGYLAGYAAFKNHVSFFPASAALLPQFAAELKNYSTSKCTIRFQADKPLPSALVRRIIKARIAENEARQALRSRR